MHSNLLKQLMFASKQAFYVFLVQVIAMHLLSAESTKSQELLKETYISIQIKEASLSEVFEIIESKTYFNFTFGNEVIKDKKRLSLFLNKQNLRQILEQIAKKSNYNFRRINNNIYVIPRKRNKPIEIKEEFADRTIKGKVTDGENGEALTGVNVVVSKSSIGTITDVDGTYTIEVPDNAEKLTFSFVGYKMKEVTIGDRSVIDVVMNLDLTALDEIVVVGYSTQDKYQVSAAVSQVEAEALEINKRPVANIESALVGSIPGLILDQSSGQLGETVDIKVREASALQSRNALVLIDGFEGRIENINPQDIESVTILKDAAATAIFGARSANGVVLITTRQTGRNQEFSVTYSSNVAWQRPFETADMTTSRQFMEFTNESLINEVLRNNPDLTPDDVDVEFSEENISRAVSGFYPETNWVEELYSETSVQQTHNLSVNGGSDNIGYYLNLGYLGQNGMIAGDDKLERVNLRAKIDAEVTDWLTIGTNVMNTYRNLNNVPVVGGTSLRGRPFYPVKTEDGIWVDKGAAGGEPNPVARSQSGSFDRRKTDALNLQFYAQLKPIENLKLEGRISYVTNNINRELWNTPYEFIVLDEELNPVGEVVEINSANRSLSVNSSRDVSLNTLAKADYKIASKGHNFNILAGFQTQESQFREFGASRFDFILPNLQDLSLGQTISGLGNSSSNPGKRTTVSLFNRVSYNFKGKYLAEFNFRADASSYFLDNNKWALFPAVSLGWNMHEETFFRNLTFMDVLKIRGSWGLNGDDFGINATETVITIPGGVAFGSQVVPAIVLGNSINPNLTWETSNKVNLGLDLVLWNGKLSFTGDYFIDRRDDIIAPLIVASEVGVNLDNLDIIPGGVTTLEGILDNVYSAKSWGWEFALNHRSEIGRFGVNAGINLSYYNSEVTDANGVDPLNPSAQNFQRKGLPIQGNWFGYETDGFFNSEDEIENHVTENGDPIDQSAVVSQGDDLGRYLGGFKYLDQLTVDTDGDGRPDTKDGVINADDRIVLEENTQDNYRLGFNLELTYAGFSLSTRLYGAFRAFEWWNDGDFLNPFSGNVAPYLYQTNTWRPDNQDSFFPSSTATNIIPYESNASDLIQHRKYIKVKNINLGYTFNQKVIEKLRWVKGLNLYVSLENLGVLWSDYPLFDYGWDPELGADEHSYPIPLKTSLGANITF